MKIYKGIINAKNAGDIDVSPKIRSLILENVVFLVEDKIQETKYRIYEYIYRKHCE